MYFYLNFVCRYSSRPAQSWPISD